MRNYKEHLLHVDSSVKTALIRLDTLGMDATLFIVDDRDRLIGSLTDGDVRRGLINGLQMTDTLKNILQANPKYLRKGETNIDKVIYYRDNNFRVIPIVEEDNKVTNVINFRESRSYLPIDAVIMAGGRGLRLKPLTDTTPKPLLLIGNRPIMEYNIDRLSLFGIDNFWFSVKYLGEQIETYFGNGEKKNISIRYIKEDEPMGTIGAVSMVDSFLHDYILILNSDILTNLDYEHFFLDFVKKNADFAVVTIPYQVSIPYAVLETVDGKVKDFKEKPTYTYYSNGGIYLMRKSVLSHIPQNTFFNATDLMEVLIQQNYNVVSFPLTGYWLDIGKHEDFAKAQQDIDQIKF